jgi:murein DD-endopeptidase MepM/ murein hydrolase activator NlpD
VGLLIPLYILVLHKPIISITFFVDITNMAIIKNQNIAKRSKSSSKHYNNTLGINTNFMSQFTQKPARKTSRVKKSILVNNQKISRNRNEKPRSSGFSFSIPSLATLSVVAGIIVIALAALKWNDIEIKIPENYVFQPIVNENTDGHTMFYASTGIANLTSRSTPSLQLPEINSSETPDSVLTQAETGSIQSTLLDITDIDPSQDVTQDLLITFKWQDYRVQRGDTVSGIAQRFKVSMGAIIASNEIRNARNLQAGAVLRIPNIDGIPYKVKSGDNLSKISASFNVPLEVILDVNDIKSDVIRAGETIFIPGARMNDADLRLSLGEMFMYPVQRVFITSRYGMRRDPISGNLSFHTGIDLRASTGTIIMASMDGTVAVTGENRIYGKHIILRHSNGYKTLYAHLNAFSVKEGDRVLRGRKIGEAGNTGYSTGSHLHFGVYDKNGNLINPLDILR